MNHLRGKAAIMFQTEGPIVKIDRGFGDAFGIADTSYHVVAGADRLTVIEGPIRIGGIKIDGTVRRIDKRSCKRRMAVFSETHKTDGTASRNCLHVLIGQSRN